MGDFPKTNRFEDLKKYYSTHGNLGKVYSFFQFISLKTNFFPQVSTFFTDVEFGQRQTIFPFKDTLNQAFFVNLQLSTRSPRKL